MERQELQGRNYGCSMLLLGLSISLLSWGEHHEGFSPDVIS